MRRPSTSTFNSSPPMKRSMRKFIEASKNQRTIEANDLPGQFLGRTPGNLNGFDIEQNDINLSSYLE